VKQACSFIESIKIIPLFLQGTDRIGIFAGKIEPGTHRAFMPENFRNVLPPLPVPQLVTVH
jgi:hypothetical protein